MRPTTRLKALIHDPRILVMPGAYDPISAKLIERAGFDAIQCTGSGISAAFLGRPDYGIVSMNDMLTATRHIVDVVGLPVMADGDTGFGNAVNAYLTVQAFEKAGAAGINLEDQVAPKRCGHLDGKQIIPFEEAVTKVRAACEARRDPDFVINARTDALAVAGMDEVVRRGNAFLGVGATMVMIDGVETVEQIRAAVAGIRGPVAINIVEGGKTRFDCTFEELQALGVARVSLPGTLVRAALYAMQEALRRVKADGSVRGLQDMILPFAQGIPALMGMQEVNELEQRYATPTAS
jgi:2-methylisocitrate lyase-like PEP mutase family enzyme